MTTFVDEKQKCYVCGTESTCKEVSTTNEIGPRDLDNRPAEMMRSTIQYWICRCPKCGYCAPDISTGNKRVKQIIESAAYLTELNNTSYSQLANSFLCWALIQEKLRKYADSGRYRLYAAWVCDDEKKGALARDCRAMAVESFDKGITKGQSLTEDGESQNMVIVDILRRAGQFERAAKLCEGSLSTVQDGAMRKMLEYQKRLISNKDDRRHTFEEAFKK